MNKTRQSETKPQDDYEPGKESSDDGGNESGSSEADGIKGRKNRGRKQRGKLERLKEGRN
jgi:hypothetical protein